MPPEAVAYLPIPVAAQQYHLGDIMKVLITGAHGKVGRAAAQAMVDAGHEVLTTDLTRPGFERKPEGTPKYMMADLTDAGEA